MCDENCGKKKGSSWYKFYYAPLGVRNGPLPNPGHAVILLFFVEKRKKKKTAWVMGLDQKRRLEWTFYTPMVIRPAKKKRQLFLFIYALPHASPSCSGTAVMEYPTTDWCANCLHSSVDLQAAISGFPSTFSRTLERSSLFANSAAISLPVGRCEKWSITFTRWISANESYVQVVSRGVKV